MAEGQTACSTKEWRKEPHERQKERKDRRKERLSESEGGKQGRVEE